MCDTVVLSQNHSSSGSEVALRTGVTVGQMTFEMIHKMPHLSFGQKTFSTSTLINAPLLNQFLDLFTDFFVYIKRNYVYLIFYNFSFCFLFVSFNLILMIIKPMLTQSAPGVESSVTKTAGITQPIDMELCV